MRPDRMERFLTSVIIYLGLFALFLGQASPYVISHNRVISLVSSTTLAKAPIVLSVQEQEHLNRECRAKEGAWAYQAGYADACDWLLGEVGIRKGFASKPSNGFEAIYVNRTRTITFKVDEASNSFRLNMSLYTLDLHRVSDGAPRSVDCLNVTYMSRRFNGSWYNETLRPWIWEVHLR